MQLEELLTPGIMTAVLAALSAGAKVFLRQLSADMTAAISAEMRSLHAKLDAHVVDDQQRFESLSAMIRPAKRRRKAT